MVLTTGQWTLRCFICNLQDWVTSSIRQWSQTGQLPLPQRHHGNRWTPTTLNAHYTGNTVATAALSNLSSPDSRMGTQLRQHGTHKQRKVKRDKRCRRQMMVTAWNPRVTKDLALGASVPESTSTVHTTDDVLGSAGPKGQTGKRQGQSRSRERHPPYTRTTTVHKTCYLTQMRLPPDSPWKDKRGFCTITGFRYCIIREQGERSVTQTIKPLIMTDNFLCYYSKQCPNRRLYNKNI